MVRVPGLPLAGTSIGACCSHCGSGTGRCRWQLNKTEWLTVILPGAVTGIVTIAVVTWRCGPASPWTRTRVQLTKLEWALQPCDTHRPLASAGSCLQQLRQMTGAANPIRWHDGFGTPLQLSVSSKCWRVPFCGAYSAGPDRSDDCGAGDDLPLPRCAAFLGPPAAGQPW